MTGRTVAAILALLALAGCGGGTATPAAKRDTRGDVVRTTTTKVEVVQGLGGGGFDPHQIYDREAPGVVTVISLFGNGGITPLLDPNSGGDSGLGSGFVLDGKGEIATNAHVVTSGQGNDIQRARQVYVEFADGNRVSARIVGHDPNADVALLRIDPQGLELRPLPLGTLQSVQVGAPVAAMGSPFGEQQSLSVGVVSALHRDIESLTDFRISGAIQTDAAINPGNSGGPLVNAKGEVIGINQQIKTNSGGGEGVGFAVPIDIVKRSLDQLRKSGRARYAYVGISSQRIYPQLAKRFDLPVERGAWIQEITPGGPAERAGLHGGSGRPVAFQAGLFCAGGDVVVKIGGKPVSDSTDLADAVAARQPGDRVDIELFRGHDRRKIAVTLADRPANVAAQRSSCAR